MRFFQVNVLFKVFFICLLALALDFSSAAARPKYLFKVASLAPANSVWAKRFSEFAASVTEKTGGEVGFKIYAGGVMGDERAMYRKMRVGQIHGGGFTMTGIGEVVPDFRVMSVPFLFNSYDEVDQVIEKIWPQLQEKFAARGLALIAPTEVGFVYTMSVEDPINSIEALRNSRSWSPDGDPVGLEFFKAAKVAAIPLLIQDVLPSLEAGMVNTVYNSFYGSIVLQWHYKIKHITNIPFAYAYGAFVLDKKRYSALPPALARIVEQEAQVIFKKLLVDTRQSNGEALEVLKEKGVNLISFDQKTVRMLHEIRRKTVDAIAGKAFSREIYHAVVETLEAYHPENSQSPPESEKVRGLIK